LLDKNYKNKKATLQVLLNPDLPDRRQTHQHRPFLSSSLIYKNISYKLFINFFVLILFLFGIIIFINKKAFANLFLFL
jgi:hypothetical protein